MWFINSVANRPVELLLKTKAMLLLATLGGWFAVVCGRAVLCVGKSNLAFLMYFRVSSNLVCMRSSKSCILICWERRMHICGGHLCIWQPLRLLNFLQTLP